MRAMNHAYQANSHLFRSSLKIYRRCIKEKGKGRFSDTKKQEKLRRN